MAPRAPTVWLKRWEIRFWIFRIEINELQPEEALKEARKEFPNHEAGNPFQNPPTITKGDYSEKV